MLPIMSLFATKIMPVIGGAFWSRLIVKRLTDHILSEKIDEILENIRQKIIDWYLLYRWDMLLTIVFNAIIIGITLISFYFFTINDIIKCIVSFICIIMIIRFLIRTFNLIVNTIIPNWYSIIHYTHILLIDLFGGYGISESIRDTIHVAFITVYDNNSNDFTKGIHTVFSKLGFTKSRNDISEEVQNVFYSLITGYTIRLIIYRIIAFTVYLLVFNFLLRPFIFSYTLKLNVLQVIFYPFAVAIPRVIMIIKGSL